MTTKSVPKRGAGRKAARLSEADWTAAERIRVILSDPKARPGVKTRLGELAYKLYAETNAFSEPTPDSCADEFISGTASLLVTPDADAQAVHDEIVKLAEQHEPEEYKVARRVVAAYDAQDAREGEKGLGCHFFMENYVDPLMSESGDSFMCASPHVELFILLFVRAAREYRGEEPPNRWTDLLGILDRAETEEGFDFEKEREEHKRRFAEIGEEIKAEELAKPEPKDKTSDAWRYWQLRHIEAGFESDNVEEYRAAWGAFWRFFDGFKREPNAATVETARGILPGLIIAFQRAEGYRQRDRRSEAGRRGAETRRKKTAKRGGAR